MNVDDTDIIILDEDFKEKMEIKYSNKYRIRVEKNGRSQHRFIIQQKKCFFWTKATPGIDIKLVSYYEHEAVSEYNKIVEYDKLNKTLDIIRRNRCRWSFVGTLT